MNKFSCFVDAEKIKASQTQTNSHVFIYSKGYEDRSYTVFEKYIDVIAPQTIIMLDSRMKNEGLSSSDVIKYDSIKTIAESKGITNIKTISMENANVGSYLKSENLSSNMTIAIDISSMNFWELSDLLYYLIRVVQVKQVVVFYTEPDLYHYENDNISQYSHTQTQVSIKYPKSYYSTKTTEEEVLVSMIGFQKDVNKLMKDMFEVSDYFSVNGFPSFYPKAKDISQTNNADFLSEIDPSKRFSAEAINPFITYNTLIDISKACGGAFMNICPLCSKPMAVGACMYALKYPETTRIVYPYEESVTTRSDGIGHTYCYSITQSYVS